MYSVTYDEQYEQFVKSIKEPKRLVELLLEIQMVCLTNENFKNHSNIEELKKIGEKFEEKIESKKIILDKAISALKEIDKRYVFIHTKNRNSARKMLSTLS